MQIVAAHLQAKSYITKKNKQQNKETGVETIGYSRGILFLPQEFDFKCYKDARFAADLDTRRSTTSLHSVYVYCLTCIISQHIRLYTCYKWYVNTTIVNTIIFLEKIGLI